MIQKKLKNIVANIFKVNLTKKKYLALKNSQKSQKTKLNISDGKKHFILMNYVLLLQNFERNKVIYLDAIRGKKKKMEKL